MAGNAHFQKETVVNVLHWYAGPSITLRYTHTHTYLTDTLARTHTPTHIHTNKAHTPGSDEYFGEIRALNALSQQQHRENNTGIYDNRRRTNKEVWLRVIV